MTKEEASRATGLAGAEAREDTSAAARAKAAAVLTGALRAAMEAGHLAMAGAAAEAEAVRLACRAVAGAVLAGDTEEALARRWADLRLLPGAGMAPWPELNRVLEAALGEVGAERVKARAAALVRAETRPSAAQPGPAARVNRGAPSYSRRLRERLRGT